MHKFAIGSLVMAVALCALIGRVASAEEVKCEGTIAKIDLFVSQHIEKLLFIPQGYIYGWQAFHMDRVFPKSIKVQP